MNRVTGAAVKLKALVRRQMDMVRKRQLAQNSSLAEFMLAPLYGMAFVVGLENDQVESSCLDLDDFFEKNLIDIFRPMEFQESLEKISSTKKSEVKDLELCGPDALVRARAELGLRTSGCPMNEEWKETLEHFDSAKDAVGRWNRSYDEVNNGEHTSRVQLLWCAGQLPSTWIQQISDRNHWRLRKERRRKG